MVNAWSSCFKWGSPHYVGMLQFKKVPKITNTFAVTTKNMPKIINQDPLGAHQEANGLMYKVYYYSNRL